MFNSYIQIHTHARVHTHTQLWHLPFECLWWLSYWMRNRLSVSHPITSNNKLNFVIREGLPRWLHGKESACNVKDVGSIPGLERSPEVGNGNPLQYSCWENPMDRGACQAAVPGVTKSQTRLELLSTHAPTSQGTSGVTSRWRSQERIFPGASEEVQLCWHLDLELLASNCEKINFPVLSLQGCSICCWVSRELVHPLSYFHSNWTLLAT